MLLFLLAENILDTLLPPIVWNFLLPGIAGGVVVFLVINAFTKILFDYDILKEIGF